MNKLFILLLAATTLLLSCDKSFEKFEANSNGYADTVWANVSLASLPINDLNKGLTIAPFVDSVPAQTGGTLYFPNGASVTIPGHCFLLNGATVNTGKVTITFLLITKKGDMVRMALPTQSDGYLLESGGEIYIEATQNGKPLTMNSTFGYRMGINYRSSTPPSSLMKGFLGVSPTGVSGQNSCFNWLTAADSTFKITTTTNGYQIFTTNLNWINCDYFSDTAAPKTTIALSMPLGFTNANTNAYIIYKYNNGIMQFAPDAVNKIWVKERVPTAKAVLYITISKRGEDYYFGSTESYTSANQHVVIKPSKQKLQDIINYLGTL